MYSLRLTTPGDRQATHKLSCHKVENGPSQKSGKLNSERLRSLLTIYLS